MPTQPMSCSGRLLGPFLTVLAKRTGLEREVELARAVPIQSRIAVASFHDQVSRWVRATLDPDLGLRAGQVTSLGTCGVLDYALRTAPTLIESFQLARRHAHLYSEALEFAVVRQQDRVSIRVAGPLAAPRAPTDFMLATWYRNHLQPHLDADADLECWFSYPKPVSVDLHRSVFGGAKLNFGAPFSGFSFEHHQLGRALETADAAAHELHCEQLDRANSLAVHFEPLAMRARRILATEMQRGRPTAYRLARRLQLSRRTLVRHLAREGTSFTLLLDGLRRQLGTRLVLEGALPLHAIASSLGFSHVQGFHRSFRRWTGMAPTRYRETTLRGPAAA